MENLLWILLAALMVLWLVGICNSHDEEDR